MPNGKKTASVAKYSATDAVNFHLQSRTQGDQVADTAAVQDETGQQILGNGALRRAACGPQEGGRIAAPVCALARNDKGAGVFWNSPVRCGGCPPDLSS